MGNFPTRLYYSSWNSHVVGLLGFPMSCLLEYRIAGKFDEQNIWRFAPPKVFGGFKFSDG